MTTLLAVLILVVFTVCLCYLAGDEYINDTYGWAKYTTFREKITSGADRLAGVCFVSVVVVVGIFGTFVALT